MVGSGLGLALTKKLVELHKGRIAIRSDIGVGTSMEIDIPVVAEAYAPQNFRPNPSPQPDLPHPIASNAEPSGLFRNDPGLEKLLILVIEDDKDVRKYIRICLGPGFRLLEAENGRIGLRIAAEHVPDLIICDVMMPEIDGFEVVRRMRIQESTSHIPTILLTAKPGMESKLTGLKSGADDYLEKPFDTRELRIRIRNLIKTRQQLQQKYALQTKPKSEETSPLLSQEERFLGRVRKSVETHLSDENFTVEQLAEEIFISRGQLHRKLKALTGLSPSVFIRTVRLEHAHILLEMDTYNISETAFQVGFSSHSYFTKCFTEHFSYAPSQVLRHS